LNNDPSDQKTNENSLAFTFNSLNGLFGIIVDGLNSAVPSIKEALEDLSTTVGRLAKTHGAVSNVANIAQALNDGQLTGREIGGLIGGALGTAGAAAGLVVLGLPALTATGILGFGSAVVGGTFLTHVGSSAGKVLGGGIGSVFGEASENGGLSEGNALKKGPRRCLGRSLGGLATKIHSLTNQDGLPIRYELTPGQAHEAPPCKTLLDNLQPGQHVLAD